ncbi:MAG: RICIN domain-containing protein [Planctomycetota bacterium]
MPDDFGSFDPSTNDYRFVNRHSGKSLTVSGSPKTTPGAQIQQFLYAGDSSQQWQLNEPVPTYNTITSIASGQLMDIDANSTSEGANVVQNPADGGPAQKWQLYNTGSGFYGMINSNSSLLAGIQSSSFNDAAPPYRRPTTITSASSGSSSPSPTTSARSGLRPKPLPASPISRHLP